MVAHEQIFMRRLSDGKRSQEVRFGRFLANDKVTVERLIEGWSERTRSAASGRHVLALQDTSEIHFKTSAERRRGLGEIGKGNNYGVMLPWWRWTLAAGFASAWSLARCGRETNG
jgi:hypothetical protein